MKAFTGFAIGTLAVLGAVAAVFIYLKKKTEKEIAYDQFDDIMDSDEDFDDEFFDDDDEVLDPAKVMNKPEEEKAEDAAEAETAEEKKTFKDSLLKRRCVIPSTGFYEWDKSKQKYLFNIQGSNALYMAGLYNFFKDEPRFIILTTSANSSVSSIHHRMPVVLEKQQIEDWITDTDKAVSILHNTPPSLIHTSVN